MQEFPKILYRGADVEVCMSDTVIVQDAAGEAIARADAYKPLAEIGSEEPAPVAKRQYNRKAK
jgi:hypothetical protein